MKNFIFTRRRNFLTHRLILSLLIVTCTPYASELRLQLPGNVVWAVGFFRSDTAPLEHLRNTSEQPIRLILDRRFTNLFGSEIIFVLVPQSMWRVQLGILEIEEKEKELTSAKTPGLISLPAVDTASTGIKDSMNDQSIKLQREILSLQKNLTESLVYPDVPQLKLGETYLIALAGPNAAGNYSVHPYAVLPEYEAVISESSGMWFQNKVKKYIGTIPDKK